MTSSLKHHDPTGTDWREGPPDAQGFRSPLHVGLLGRGYDLIHQCCFHIRGNEIVASRLRTEHGNTSVKRLNATEATVAYLGDDIRVAIWALIEVAAGSYRTRG